MSIFTYKQYEILLDQMKAISNIYTFKDISKDLKSGIILRHDVDFDIQKAYDLSKVEEQKNIRSTFFILVTSDMYNPSSLKNRYMIRELQRNGFEIGLHFNPLVYSESDEEALAEKVKNECNIIENITGDKVSSISLHCPSVYNMYPVFKGYKNAYSKDFFDGELYISDSCKDFRGKNIFDFIRKARENLVQILLHPIHFSESETTYFESFNKMFEEKFNKLQDEMSINKKYKEEIGEEKLVNKFCEHINGKEMP